MPSAYLALRSYRSIKMAKLSKGCFSVTLRRGDATSCLGAHITAHQENKKRGQGYLASQKGEGKHLFLPTSTGTQNHLSALLLTLGGPEWWL
jgi:hypothetical protein